MFEDRRGRPKLPDSTARSARTQINLTFEEKRLLIAYAATKKWEEQKAAYEIVKEFLTKIRPELEVVPNVSDKSSNLKDLRNPQK